MKINYWLLGAVTCIVSNVTHCFDLATHGVVTQRSFERFLQERPGFLKDLGFAAPLNDPRALDPFGIRYFHMGWMRRPDPRLRCHSSSLHRCPGDTWKPVYDSLRLQR